MKGGPCSPPRPAGDRHPSGWLLFVLVSPLGCSGGVGLEDVLVLKTERGSGGVFGGLGAFWRFWWHFWRFRWFCCVMVHAVGVFWF